MDRGDCLLLTYFGGARRESFFGDFQEAVRWRSGLSLKGEPAAGIKDVVSGYP
jgi:hypothetical protein